MGVRELDLVQDYTGHAYDMVLGLYYAKARMYDADDRRFMAVDPYKGSIANPQTLVQYTYVLNNPLKYIDPFGLDNIKHDRPYLKAIMESQPKATPEEIHEVADFIKIFPGPSAVIVGMIDAMTYIDEGEHWKAFMTFADGTVSSVLIAKVPGLLTKLVGFLRESDKVTGTFKVFKACEKAVAEGVAKTNIAYKGSTGRTVAKNLGEQLAMEQVMSNPLQNATKISVTMTDFRWPASEGWVKMAQNVNGVEIHFVYNTLTKVFDDFKFVL